ncbi:hypothetical protein MMPV_009310 [Pyropia vietnamensis]
MDPAAISLCAAERCGELLAGGVGSPTGLLHLRQAHVLTELPAQVVAALRLCVYRWCDRPFPATIGRTGKSPLSSHEAMCRLNPRRRRQRGTSRAEATSAPSRDTAPTVPEAERAPAGAAEPAAGGLFGRDIAAWVRARASYLHAAAPTDDAWAPLIASATCTAAHVPAALVGPWRRLTADALDWVRQEPAQRQAWLWVLLLPSLLLYVPARRQAGPRATTADACLPHGRRAAAILNGDFAAVQADRNTAQKRALREVRCGRLSAAVRSLVAEPPAPQMAAVWAKAQRLFPPANPSLATTATVVLLLAGKTGAERLPAVAQEALADADLVLLAKAGGTEADGLPKLRPIGLSEVIRKPVASALA